MEQSKTMDLSTGSDFASSGSGAKVVFSTDDFFATCDNMIADSEPVFDADKFTEFGKWMDGWESRRKRIAGHDWCVIKLATRCIIQAVLVDTAYFTGNYAPKYSIQAANLSFEEEALIPVRESRMGTSCTTKELEQMVRLHSDKWEEVIPRTALRPGYEETRKNYQMVSNSNSWTHIRVNIYPDGGIARLRVFGNACPETPEPNTIVDLISLLNGGACQGYSNAHYGHPKNMIKPSKSECMADGWETARRSDRPEVIEVNDDGTLKVPGNEWAIFKLGFPGSVKKILVDTAHFKGNFPDSIVIEGLDLGQHNWQENSDVTWNTILGPKKLSAHQEHIFECDSGKVTHIRVTIAPDGGISRIKLLGFVDR